MYFLFAPQQLAKTAELTYQRRSCLRTDPGGSAQVVRAVPDERLEVGVSFRSDSEFFAHIVRSAQHRAVASVAQHAYVLARKLEKVAVKGGNDDIVFPGKPDGIRGYYVVGLKLLDLGVPQSEVIKRRVYVGKL